MAIAVELAVGYLQAAKRIFEDFSVSYRSSLETKIATEATAIASKIAAKRVVITPKIV
jgi:hypothetical protein